ncbi:hypothetical protein ACFY1B_47655 [Streptomyces mirabilis]|uniref:hypothetical protein n=1 Tax=Streptomyces mirabilis TaxID=68239 RepID=UPI0036B35CB0
MPAGRGEQLRAPSWRQTEWLTPRFLSGPDGLAADIQGRHPDEAGATHVDVGIGGR